jgi:hypothetical protein
MREYLSAIRGPFALGIVATSAALPIGIIAMPHDRASALIPLLLSSAIFCTIYAIPGWRLDYLPRFGGGGKNQSPGRPLFRFTRPQRPVVSRFPADDRLSGPASTLKEPLGRGGSA